MIAKLFGVRMTLSALEKLVLGCVRARLPEPIGVLWDRQIGAINKVQRLPDGIEVNFYRMKNGRPTFYKDLAFPNKDDELQVAIVQMKILNMTALTADVWCVSGFLFSIEYRGEVKYFEEAASLVPASSIILDCTLTADLAADAVR